MGSIQMLRVCCEHLFASWRHRRDESGGVLDETGMIFIGFMAAVVIGGVVYGLVTAINFDMGELWGGG